VTLRPDDLRRRSFATAADGYDRDEVHGCLAQVADVLEELQRTVERLSAATDGDLAAPAATHLGPVEGSAAAPTTADARASERALFVAIRLLLEDASEAEVEQRLRDELAVEPSGQLIAEALERAARLKA
jgi:DivIVA domain-containing protein